MTNREVIERLKELGFEDRTEAKYWSYETWGGPMRQRLQDSTLDFVKDYGENTITIGVSNDIWSFDGLKDDDDVTTNEAVWLNHGYDNEDIIKVSGAIASIEEDGDYIVFTVRKRNPHSYSVYKQEIKVSFDEYDEDDDWEDDEE